MIAVGDIASTIESFAPCKLQESYDNAGLQVGDPSMPVSGVLLCLDVNEAVLREAKQRRCNMVISHHPLLFGGIMQVTPCNERGRIIIEAVKEGIALYAAHTNLDRTWEGVSYEMARILGLKDISVLCPDPRGALRGLGIVGDIEPTPALSFLRRVKDTFNVDCLRYSRTFPKLTLRRVAVCGGAGASLIRNAIDSGADVMLTGDLKYHDYTSYSDRILLADIGHYESELCSKKIFARILREKFPELTVVRSEDEVSPINSI